MNERINDKIRELRQFLEELDEIRPASLSFYQHDLKTRAACERYIEKIVEAIIDLSFLAIKHLELETPEDDKQAFDILVTSKVITTELAERLKDAKGMRNILAHQYGNVDDVIVFEAVDTEIEKDARALIAAIEMHLSKQPL